MDDDPTVLRLLGTALLSRGFDVRAAREAGAGLEILLDELLDLDVLVVDGALPGRDGASLVRLVREAGGERDLAVVVLVDRAGPGAVARLLALGADAVVDRLEGPRATVDTIAAVAPRRAERASRRTEAAAAPSRGELLVLDDARRPPPGLAAAAA